MSNAHKVTDTSAEAFALRLFKERSEAGFIKAFTDNADRLVGGYARLAKTMRALWVKKLHLWPRFQAVVRSDLEAHSPGIPFAGKKKIQFMT